MALGPQAKVTQCKGVGKIISSRKAKTCHAWQHECRTPAPLCAYMYIYIYIRMQKGRHVQVFLYIYIYIHTDISIYIDMHTYFDGFFTYIYTYVQS